MSFQPHAHPNADPLFTALLHLELEQIGTILPQNTLMEEDTVLLRPFAGSKS